ncbi:MAG: hypothetical protein LAT76_07850 [Schleiferiaceae bacterium]|nr:hypothetical protein [Schleiferiaceae bacterium]
MKKAKDYLNINHNLIYSK